MRNKSLEDLQTTSFVIDKRQLEKVVQLSLENRSSKSGAIRFLIDRGLEAIGKS